MHTDGEIDPESVGRRVFLSRWRAVQSSFWVTNLNRAPKWVRARVVTKRVWPGKLSEIPRTNGTGLFTRQRPGVASRRCLLGHCLMNVDSSPADRQRQLSNLRDARPAVVGPQMILSVSGQDWLRFLKSRIAGWRSRRDNREIRGAGMPVVRNELAALFLGSSSEAGR